VAQRRADAIEAERRIEKISGIAEKAGVDVNELLDLSDGNPEKAQIIATRLAGTKPPADTKAKESVENPEEPDLTVIPSRGTGGGDKLLSLSPKERREERERRLREGKAK
jgi:hypothetical protein